MMTISTEMIIVLVFSALNAASIIVYHRLAKKLLKSNRRVLVELDSYKQRIKKDIGSDWIGLRKSWEAQVYGIINKFKIKAKVSQVLAERAFNMASSSNVALMHLQRTLQVRPAYVPRKKQVENEGIQEDVMESLGGSSSYEGFDWLYPILNDEEREIVDNARDFNAKYKEPLKD